MDLQVRTVQCEPHWGRSQSGGKSWNTFSFESKAYETFQPGLKILQFLRNLNAGEGKVHNIQYTTTKAEENSEALKNMQALDEHQVVGWISYWKKIGFLPGSPRNGVTQRL